MLPNKEELDVESNGVAEPISATIREKTNLLTNSISSPAILLAPDGTAKWMNSAACDLTGWDQHSFGRLPVFLTLDLRTPDNHQDIQYKRDTTGIIRLDPAVANHLLISDRSGKTHHVSCSSMGIESSSDCKPDSLLLLSDISASFVDSPNENAYQFQIDQLVDASNAATWSMDIDTGKVTVNDRWYTILGYEPGELYPIDMVLWREIVHPDDHPISIRDLDLHFQGLLPRYEADIRMRHKDGHWVWIHAVGKVNEWHEDGSAKILLGSHQDITERKLSEQRLKDSETHLRKLLDNLFVFVAVLSADGRIEWANKTPLAAAGLTLDDVVGKLFWEAPWFVKGEPSVERMKLACLDAMNGKQSRFDTEQTRPNGEISVEDFMISPLFDDDGNVTHLIPTAADISGRHQIMKEAEDAKHLLESVIENIPALVFVKDAKELRYTHLNRTGETMTGKKREDLLGKNTYDIFPHDEAVAFERHDREALTLEHGTDVIDHPVTRGDGTPGFYRTCKVAMRDADANATHLVGISLDVTSLVESEEALKNVNRDLEARVAERTKELEISETRFRLAMHESSIGMALVSLEGVWLDVNKRIIEMLGYSKEELLKIDFQEITHPEDLEPDLAQLRKLLASEIPSYQIDKRFIHKAGHTVWAQLNVARANDENGHGLYLVSQLQDITRDKLRTTINKAITQDFLNLAFDDYCEKTTGKLCELFNFKAAYISEFHEGSKKSLRTRALFLNGTYLPTYHYERASISLSTQNGSKEAIIANKDFLQEYKLTHCAEVPMFNSTGRLVGYIGVMHKAAIDVNEGLLEALELFAVAVGATLERERSQKRYYDLVAFAPDGMLMLDWDGNIKLANQAAEKQLMYKNSELLGCKLSDLVVAEEKHRIVEFIHHANMAVEENTASTETFAIRSDGIRYPVELRTSLAGDEHGQLLSVTMTDLSIRYEAEREMRQALAMLDATEDAAFILDPDTFKFTYVNQATVKQIGYSKSELVGKMGPADIIPNLTEDKLHADLSGLNRRNGKRTEFKTVHRHRDGHKVPVHTTIRFIELPNDQTCYAALSRDITDRIQQEEDRVARVQAEESNAAKSAFLAAMSHEIRTPMNGVIGSVDLLARSSLMAQQIDLVDTISDSANGLLRVIDDILDFSKIDAGKLTLESEPVSLMHETEIACAALAPVALQKNVDLFLYTDPGLPNWVLSDSVRIRQILNNLVSNAIKFSTKEGQRGTVKIAIERLAKASVRIEVEDNGIGMKQEALDQLFQPFAQAESSTTRRFGGTGLGLSICRRLVEMLDGSIEVTSDFGSGTSFTVTLPFTEDKATSPPPANPVLNGVSCVVVSSAAFAAREIITKYLGAAGASFEVCSDLNSAKAIIATSAIPKPVIITTEIDEHEVMSWRRTFTDTDAPFMTLLQNGQRRLPRQLENGVASIDQTAMTLRNFLVAVAIAAGKPGYEEELEPRSVDERRVAMNREDAIKQGQLILIAEDNEVNQKVIRRQLDLLGYAAEVKDNGREALFAWQTGDYGLLFTDLHMPEMDGYELTSSIREAETEETRIPIIALTANALKDEKPRCIERGMDDYLTKPISLDKLEAALKQWLPAPNTKGARGAEDKAVSVDIDLSGETDTPIILDTSILESLIGDDVTLIAEFLGDYEGSLDEGEVEIKKALSSTNLNALREAAHKLKSSSRSVGALGMGSYCEELEHLDDLSEDVVRSILDTFTQHAGQLRKALAEKNTTAA